MIALSRRSFAAAVTTAALAALSVTAAQPAQAKPQTAGVTVRAISMPSGPTTGGARIVVYGANFSQQSIKSVRFGTAFGIKPHVATRGSFYITVPAHAAGAVDVRVYTGTSVSPTVAADRYTYVAAPTVAAVSPAAGAIAGGTTVTVTGKHLAGATAVRFNGTPGTGLHVVSATKLTVTAPANSAGPADVRVTTEGGTSNLAGAASRYTYIAPPVISSITPTSGSTAGGTTVQVTGTDLATASGVTFGGVAGVNPTVTSPTTVTVIAPAHSAGLVDVQVSTAYGTSAAVQADHYTYVAPPTITQVSPGSGSSAGGTAVTITGTGLATTTSVTFDGVPGTNVVPSETSVTVTSPAHVATTVDINVDTAYGAVASLFTYVDPPAITAISPNSGSVTGGDTVSITGTSFTGATAVSFGGTPATSFTVNSDSSITAVTPAHSVGTADVTVTTQYGTSPAVNADQFTYLPAPTVTSLSPSIGTVTGGDTVSITGTHFTGAVAVNFGASPATSFTVNSDTSITAVTPAHTATTVDVTVTSSSGTSATSSADQFTFVNTPTVLGVTPNSGPAPGGTSVTLTGTDFTGVTTVLFGSTPAAFAVLSATTIIVISPAEVPGSVGVTVIGPGGQSFLLGADIFTYI